MHAIASRRVINNNWRTFRCMTNSPYLTRASSAVWRRPTREFQSMAGGTARPHLRLTLDSIFFVECEVAHTCRKIFRESLSRLTMYHLCASRRRPVSQCLKRQKTRITTEAGRDRCRGGGRPGGFPPVPSEGAAQHSPSSRPPTERSGWE